MHRLQIFYVSDRKGPSSYFSSAIKNVRNYFSKVDISYFQMSEVTADYEKWIIVIVNQIPLEKIKKEFFEHFNKSFTLFLYLTKEYTEETIERAYEKEFDYVMNMQLTSPKNFSLFLRNVIIKRLEIKAKNQRINVGEITADIINNRIWVNEEEKILTRREFDVLLTLLKKPNRYVSQDDIFQAVWKTDDFDRTRSVSQYIHRLKNKIGYEYFDANTSLGYKITSKPKK